jgi:hypothetical protein
LLSVGAAVDTITLAPGVRFLANNLSATEWVVIAGSVEIDDIALARILEHGSIPG